MSIPQDFESTLKSIQLYRQINLAPVDAMGCNILTKQTTPAISRYHTLISLLISSQTKDTINFEAMQLLRGLKNGLTVDSILQENPLLIHACIKKVGYHNKKLVYIIESTRILRDKFDSDVPDTLEGLLSLPGVGPKMAYIALQSAWDINAGIGVDTHVHRISNRLGWVQSKTAEDTRKSLEEWMPRRLWKEINPLLVGFGQLVCGSNARCGVCPLNNEGCRKFGIVVKREKKVKNEKLNNEYEIKFDLNEKKDTLNAQVETIKVVESSVVMKQVLIKVEGGYRYENVHDDHGTALHRYSDRNSEEDTLKTNGFEVMVKTESVNRSPIVLEFESPTREIREKMILSTLFTPKRLFHNESIQKRTSNRKSMNPSPEKKSKSD